MNISSPSLPLNALQKNLRDPTQTPHDKEVSEAAEKYNAAAFSQLMTHMAENSAAFTDDPICNGPGVKIFRSLLIQVATERGNGGLGSDMKAAVERQLNGYARSQQ